MHINTAYRNLKNWCLDEKMEPQWTKTAEPKSQTESPNDTRRVFPGDGRPPPTPRVTMALQGKSPFEIGKSTINCHFNSYVCLPEGT